MAQLLQLQTILSLILLYPILVRLLRYRNLAKQNASVPRGSSLSGMTVATAQNIIHRFIEQEFPSLFKRALQFALFRTYGIPSISKLLMDTSLFSEYESASKRYADTIVLISEFITRDIGSEDWIKAVARLNCIHGKYVVSGRILNDDLLYTLALFAREPQRWIDRYEWRQVSDVEKCAIGVFWKTIGDAMEIDMSGLPTRKKGENWRDGLHWFEEISQWADDYEAEKMVPTESNEKVAQQTTTILLWNVPSKWKPLGMQVISSLMDTRLRRAMSIPAPPSDIERRVKLGLRVRGLFLKYLALPRPYFLRYSNITQDPTPEGTYRLSEYDSLPYYIEPSFLNRWGPGALVRRYRGIAIPGDEGTKYYPQGYKTVEVGPNHGKMHQAEFEKKVEVVGQRRCPMAFA